MKAIIRLSDLLPELLSLLIREAAMVLKVLAILPLWAVPEFLVLLFCLDEEIDA